MREKVATRNAGNSRTSRNSWEKLEGIKKNGENINLTIKEYDLLLLFLRNKGRALQRQQIYSAVWEEEYMGDSRTVDLHVQRIRKKLNLESKIVPVYKIGYRLED